MKFFITKKWKCNVLQVCLNFKEFYGVPKVFLTRKFSLGRSLLVKMVVVVVCTYHIALRILLLTMLHYGIIIIFTGRENESRHCSHGKPCGECVDLTTSSQTMHQPQWEFQDTILTNNLCIIIILFKTNLWERSLAFTPARNVWSFGIDFFITAAYSLNLRWK